MGKLVLLACLVSWCLASHASSAYADKARCTSVPSMECNDVDKPQVEHKTETKCKTVYNKECKMEYTTVYDDVTTKYDKVCETQNEKMCEQVNKQQCSTSRKECHIEYDTVIETVPKRECKQVQEEVCTKVPKEECKDVSSTKCSSTSERECNAILK